MAMIFGGLPATMTMVKVDRCNRHDYRCAARRDVDPDGNFTVT